MYARCATASIGALTSSGNPADSFSLPFSCRSAIPFLRLIPFPLFLAAVWCSCSPLDDPNLRSRYFSICENSTRTRLVHATIERIFYRGTCPFAYFSRFCFTERPGNFYRRHSAHAYDSSFENFGKVFKRDNFPSRNVSTILNLPNFRSWSRKRYLEIFGDIEARLDAMEIFFPTLFFQLPVSPRFLHSYARTLFRCTLYATLDPLFYIRPLQTMRP